LLFPQGIFAPRVLGIGRVAELIENAIERFSGTLRGSDIVHAAVAECVAGRHHGIGNAMGLALVRGARLESVLSVIDGYNAAGTDSYGFDGSADMFSPELHAALADFAAEVEKDPERAREVGLELLLACVLEHPDEGDREFLRLVLSLQDAAEGLRGLVRLRPSRLPGLWDSATGRLRSEEFTPDAWAVLEQAAGYAGDSGYDNILTVHCLLGLLSESEGMADRALRRQLPPQVGVGKAVEVIAGAFRMPKRGDGVPVPQLDRDDVSIGLRDRLQAAQVEAASWGAEQVAVPHLLTSVLADPSERLAAVLRGQPLGLDLRKLREHVKELILDASDGEPREVHFKLPASLPPSEDLTWAARTGAITPAGHLDAYCEELCRALHRSTSQHVMLTGLPGVGRTTVLRELARRAAQGEVPFLRRKRFIRVDCRDVAPERSEAVLNGLLAQIGGRTDIVLCVDSLGPLLRGPQEARNNLILRSALAEGRIRLIGVLTVHDYEDLVAVDHELLDLTSRIEIAEPDHATAQAIVRRCADEIEARFAVRIEDSAVGRAVVLAGDFLPRHRLPDSAVRTLFRACENFDYERSFPQAGDNAGEKAGDEAGATTSTTATSGDEPPPDTARPAVIGVADVVRAVSELCGIPVEQLGGDVGERLDYADLLGRRVVGQAEAVRIVTQEMRRIKTGLAAASPGPASVLLFAGLTGVGKTELAKAIADIYSASKRLQTYPMENFTEPHSVSAFLGSPPGYKGYESGGRLINELNADPYCVVLLDEVEKAHPEVLRPFLNLFDEGWIADQRGVKAYADRAIIVLTTNAGHDVIAAEAGRCPDDEIATKVQEALRAVQNRHGDPIFTPELLARIRLVVVFKPLTREAMVGICRIKLDSRSRFWKHKREKELRAQEDVVQFIADEGHRLNTKAGGTEGGRIIDKLIADLVDGPVAVAAEEREAEYRSCRRIEVGLDPAGRRTEVRLVDGSDDGDTLDTREAEAGR
jgi:ATP-dependent Clp protease ATP-binding subunit ClpA